MRPRDKATLLEAIESWLGECHGELPYIDHDGDLALAMASAAEAVIDGALASERGYAAMRAEESDE